jgi:hypothetical protein
VRRVGHRRPADLFLSRERSAAEWLTATVRGKERVVVRWIDHITCFMSS